MFLFTLLTSQCSISTYTKSIESNMSCHKLGMQLQVSMRKQELWGLPSPENTLQRATLKHEESVSFDFVLLCDFTDFCHRPRGLLVSSSYGTRVTLRASSVFVLIYSGIENGYQLLCDAHTVLEPDRGTAAFFFFTHYRPFPLFFLCVCHS